MTREVIERTPTGTDLYRRTIEHDYGDQERADLVRKVWDGTPWMVDAYTGSWSTEPDRRMSMIEWCVDRFGPPAWPIHGKPGRWQEGGVTIHGWTWFGFDTEDAMLAFVAAWPAPEGVEKR